MLLRTDSLETLKDSVEQIVQKKNVLSAVRNWAYIRGVITAFLLAWGIAFSVRYTQGSDEERSKLEFLDKVWLGHKHAGILVWIFQLWIVTVISYSLLESFPQLKQLLSNSN